MENLKIGPLEATPGQINWGYMNVGEYADGTEVRIPLFLIHGSQPGPTLFLSAGMHAPEVTGMEVIRKLARGGIDPQQLKGSIIACPVLNPWGIHQVEMLTPQDGVNINRTFPGNPLGTTTYRLSHTIYSQIVSKCNAIIDLHANPESAIQFSIIPKGTESVAHKISREMAAAYGITTTTGTSAGYLIEVASENGIPGIVVELVSWRRIVPEAVESALTGIQNVLKCLGMLPGEIVPQFIPRLPVETPLYRQTLTVAHGGIIHPLKQVGESISIGETIGVIRNIFGDVVEEIQSPCEGWILAWPWILNQTATTGDIVAFVAYKP